MRLSGFFTPKVMMQVGVCGALVAGTYLISHERPKDNARLLPAQDEAALAEGPFTLGTKGDRLVIAGRAEQLASAESATDETSGATRLAAAGPVEPRAEKPTVTAVASQGTTTAASATSATASSVEPAPAAAPKPKRVTVIAPPAVGHDMALPPEPAAGPAPGAPARPAPPAGWSADGYPPPAPVATMPPPPAPKPQPQQDTLFGLPPLPTPQEVFDSTVKETNAAFGKMKQAMEDAFRTN